MGFLSSISLLALFAVLIPIAIHLFSKSKGKLVSIGSIKFIEQAKPIKMTQIQWVDRILMLLRLLILLVAALILAQLYFDRSASQVSKYTLVTPQWLDIATEDDKQYLLKNNDGTKRYLLDEELTPLTDDKVANWSPIDKKSKQNSHYNFWTMLKGAGIKWVNRASFEVYTTDNAQQYAGKKTAIQQSINWHVKKTTVTDSERVIDQKVSVVILATKEREQSRDFLMAALTVLKNNIMPRLEITVIDDFSHYDIAQYDIANVSEESEQWLFYLSSFDYSAELGSLAEQGVNLFIEGGDNNDSQVVKSFIVNSGQYLLENIVFKQVAKPLPIETASQSKDVLWRSVDGKTLLTKQQTEQSRILSFYSQLNPSWNNLVSQPQFVRFILSLLSERSTERYAQEKDVISVEQIYQLTTTNNVKHESAISTPLITSQQLVNTSFWQWLIILFVVLWIIERLFSEFSLKATAERTNSSGEQ